MDHDTHEPRIRAMEDFLDAQAPGWRDGQALRRGTIKSAAIHAPLHIDDDQTRRDRRALGLDRGEVSGEGTEAGKETVDDERRTAVLAQLEPFRGVDGVAPWDGTESTDQLEGILTTARARQSGMEGTQRAPRTDTTTTDAMAIRPTVLDVPGLNATPHSPAVAIGDANVSTEANAALQTEQDPARAERAADQRDAKIAGEAVGGAPLTPTPQAAPVVLPPIVPDPAAPARPTTVGI